MYKQLLVVAEGVRASKCFLLAFLNELLLKLHFDKKLKVFLTMLMARVRRST